jgi:hypothetical protein
MNLWESDIKYIAILRSYKS